MDTMFKGIANSLSSVQELIRNIRNVIKLSFEIDSKLMSWYYVTAFIGGITPVLSPFMLKLFLDTLVRQGQVPKPITVTQVIVYLLAGYFLMQLINTTVYWGLNVSYYDYLLRNRLQNGLMLRFSKKLAQLDVQHLENSDTQNLITKVHHSYQWQIPDFVRVWNYIFSLSLIHI